MDKQILFSLKGAWATQYAEINYNDLENPI